MKKLILPDLQVKVTRKNKEYEVFNISRSLDVFELAKHIFNQDTILWQEEFILLCLSNNNEVTGIKRISSGGMTATIVDPKIVFTIALNALATGIILIHNHPSGTTKPSEQDIALTKKFVQIGKLLEIKVLDHIIVGADMIHYSSMADAGII